MGLPADPPTAVVANEPCPRLKPGPGRLVPTTVDHLNPDVWELTAVNSAGVEERLRPTGLHKFYSETRQDRVSAQEIHDNVYNMTIEGEHVYYVSELGLLAHNNCGETTSTIAGENVHKTLADERQASGEFELVQQAIRGVDGSDAQLTK